MTINQRNVLRRARELYPDLEFVKADASDFTSLDELIGSDPFDLGFHLATVPLPASLVDPVFCARTITEMSTAWLELAHAAVPHADVLACAQLAQRIHGGLTGHVAKVVEQPMVPAPFGAMLLQAREHFGGIERSGDGDDGAFAAVIAFIVNRHGASPRPPRVEPGACQSTRNGSSSSVPDHDGLVRVSDAGRQS